MTIVSLNPYITLLCEAFLSDGGHTLLSNLFSCILSAKHS